MPIILIIAIVKRTMQIADKIKPDITTNLYIKNAHAFGTLFRYMAHRFKFNYFLRVQHNIYNSLYEQKSSSYHSISLCTRSYLFLLF